MSGGSKSVTVGYWYLMGIHFGVSHGPVDALLKIEVGEREAWSGSHTANGTIYIDNPNLFGGEKREGGIQGYLDVQMGANSQGTNSYLASVQGTPQPAYRGILSAVFRKGLIAAMNPYIKPWAFKLRRIIQGWGDSGTAWYPAKAEITLSNGDKAMNPAHIVYQCLTDQNFGRGIDPGQLDEAEFTAAADTFHAEGLGLCLAWTRQGSIDSFLQVVMDHAGAVVGQHPRTGKYVLYALRDIANPSSLPLFDPSNVIELESFQRTSIAETINEVTVSYVDSTTGKPASVTVQNLANIQAQGGVVAQTKYYSGLATYDLAARVADRDLRIGSSALAKYKIKVNRTAYGLTPGKAVRFSWPKLGLTEIVLRVLRIDYGDLRNGTITMELAEDVFSLPASSYAAAQAPLWMAPSTTPVAVSYYDLREATFRDLVQNLGQATAESTSDLSGFVYGIAARPPGLTQNLDLHTKVGAASYAYAGGGDFCPTGLLSADITPTATSISLTGTIDLDQVVIGEVALLGDEIVRVDTLNIDTGAATISRGCVDTVPKPWPAGTRMWFHIDNRAPDPLEYTSGEIVDGKFVTVTTGGQLAIGSAPADAVTVTGRQGKPYPPGYLRINSQSYPATVTGTSWSISWVTRNRLIQSDQIVDADDSSITPEAGTTYTIRIRNGATNALLDSSTSATSPYIYNNASPPATLKVEVEAVRDGLTSHQAATHTWATS